MQRSSTLSHNLLLLLDRELRNNDDREIKTKKDFLFFVFVLQEAHDDSQDMESGDDDMEVKEAVEGETSPNFEIELIQNPENRLANKSSMSTPPASAKSSPVTRRSAALLTRQQQQQQQQTGNASAMSTRHKQVQGGQQQESSEASAAANIAASMKKRIVVIASSQKQSLPA